MPNLTTLMIYINHKDSGKILQFIATNKSITKLHIDGSSKFDMFAFSEAMKTNFTITHLNFSCAECTPFLDYLQGDNVVLTKLVLGYEFRLSDADLLARWLSKESCTLVDATLLFEQWIYENEDQFVNIFRTNKSITALTVNGEITRMLYDVVVVVVVVVVVSLSNFYVIIKHSRHVGKPLFRFWKQVATIFTLNIWYVLLFNIKI